MNSIAILLASIFTDHEAAFTSLLKMAQLPISLSDFKQDNASGVGIPDRVWEQRGLAVRLSRGDNGKFISLSILRQPKSIDLVSKQQIAVEQDKKVLSKMDDFSKKYSLFSGKFPITNSVKASGDRTVVIREEKPLGFEALGRSNRICVIFNRLSGLAESITVQFDRQYIAPKLVPTLEMFRKRNQNLRSASNFQMDSIVWIPQSFLQPRLPCTNLVLCYDVVTIPVSSGRTSVVHTYYDLVSGKQIGRLDSRKYENRSDRLRP